MPVSKSDEKIDSFFIY